MSSSPITTNGRAIRAARIRQGIDLADLAKAADVSYSYLSNLERGHRQGRPSVLRRIAEALAITIDDITVPTQ